MFSAKRKAFTLIEMLIVIVIIGILAAALVPRMMSARDKAADTGIQSDVQQMSSAITQYSFDYDLSTLADGTGSTLSGKLVPAYLSSMPKTASDMYFMKITRGGTASGGFILVAPVSTAGGSNWTMTGTTSAAIKNLVVGTESANTIQPCTTPVLSGTTTNLKNGTCTYSGSAYLYRMYVY